MPEPSAIELAPPDIARWRLSNTGVDYLHRFDSGRPGPTVMAVALTHGNELCGALALDWLLRQPPPQGGLPLRGRLTLAFANVAAFDLFDPAEPHVSRFVDEDLNRVWADPVLFGPRDSAELRRARALQPFVDEADVLLDIHSMSEPCRPLMVCGQADKNAAFARELGVPADLLLDTGHPSGLRMVERGGFSDPASPRRALLIECGQHWEASAEQVAVDTLLRFLRLTGAVDAEWAAPRLRLTPPPRQRVVRVSEAVVARSADFRFLVPMTSLGVIAKAGTPIARDGDHVWRAPHDDTVLVMPSMNHVRAGNTQARLGRFVDDQPD